MEIEKNEDLLGHIGLDDYVAQDGVSLVFSQDSLEERVFKGMFVTIQNEEQKFLGQILDEPKSVPVTGQTNNPLNEYPILHQETVQYVPQYKIISKVRILGQLENNRIKANFNRPKPASKVTMTSQKIIDELLGFFSC